jgi:hypothetical protein
MLSDALTFAAQYSERYKTLAADDAEATVEGCFPPSDFLPRAKVLSSLEILSRIHAEDVSYRLLTQRDKPYYNALRSCNDEDFAVLQQTGDYLLLPKDLVAGSQRHLTNREIIDAVLDLNLVNVSTFAASISRLCSETPKLRGFLIDSLCCRAFEEVGNQDIIVKALGDLLGSVELARLQPFGELISESNGVTSMIVGLIRNNSTILPQAGPGWYFSLDSAENRRWRGPFDTCRAARKEAALVRRFGRSVFKKLRWMFRACLQGIQGFWRQESAQKRELSDSDGAPLSHSRTTTERGSPRLLFQDRMMAITTLIARMYDAGLMDSGEHSAKILRFVLGRLLSYGEKDAVDDSAAKAGCRLFVRVRKTLEATQKLFRTAPSYRPYLSVLQVLLRAYRISERAKAQEDVLKLQSER